MKKIIFFAILLISTLYGCKNASDDKVDSLMQEKDSIENIFNPDFLNFLYSYGKDVNWDLRDEWVYYSLFFFKREEETYFTIWTFDLYPNVELFKEKLTNNCELCLYEVKGQKVVLIFDPKDDYAGVFSITEDCLQKARIESERENMSGIYDGDMYRRTYKISIEEPGIDFILQDSLEMPYKF